MGAPKSRFAAQFVTLLQLQTCSCCLLQPAATISKTGNSSCSKQDKYLSNSISSIQREKQLKDLKVEKTEKVENSNIAGHHVMKRRNVLDGKPRRPVKRPTTSSKIGENFYGR